MRKLTWSDIYDGHRDVRDPNRLYTCEEDIWQAEADFLNSRLTAFTSATPTRAITDLIMSWRKLAQDLRSKTLVTQSAQDQALRLEACAQQLEDCLTPTLPVSATRALSKPAFCRICGKRMNKRMPAILRVCAKCKRN